MKRKPAVVALGMFDGMHIGHRELIARCLRIAGAEDALPSVYTFSNHPQSVLRGESPKCLMSADERYALMRRLGVEDLRMVPFTRELAVLSPEAFIASLKELWTLRAVVVGYNYSFGRYGAGKADTLVAIGREQGFDVEVVPPVLLAGEPVSSTRIRALLEEGEVGSAADMLAAPYTLSGTVVKNKQFGRTIDFPTANILPDADRVLPKDGVYVSAARVGADSFRAVTNVGTNPTVGGERLSIETHLIGFSGELYGKALAVSFLERIRGEQRFDSVEALRARIALDVATARQTGR